MEREIYRFELKEGMYRDMTIGAFLNFYKMEECGKDYTLRNW